MLSGVLLANNWSNARIVLVEWLGEEVPEKILLGKM